MDRGARGPKASIVDTGAWERHHLSCCTSTNDEALRLGRAGVPHGTVVTADEQERGRGRQGRIWHSPPGQNLYLSVVLRPPLPPQRAPFLTLCAGVALADTVAATLGAAGTCQLKWPNDLLAAAATAPPRKAAGILTELVCAGDHLDFVVVGIGVNLNQHDFPDELQGRATSLFLCHGTPIEPGPFVTRLLASLGEVYDLYLREGTAPVLRRFAEHAPFLRQGQPLSVRNGGQVMTGLPAGLAHDGALLLRDEAGVIHKIVAGEF